MPETMATGRFRVAALAWTAARSGVRPDDPATVAMRSWASRTTRRYHGSLFAVADFEDERTLPTGPSTCLSEYLSAKVSGRRSATWCRQYEERKTLASCCPPSSPSIGGWLKGDCRRCVSPISVPPRCPSWPRRHAPVNSALRWDSDVSATCFAPSPPPPPPPGSATWAPSAGLSHA